ncbi:MAG: glycosyltransferase family 2 protein [Proteobacteria bacterium]|nr:glycosyltransferase family 2 protein [Pseudomonadota bacterium]
MSALATIIVITHNAARWFPRWTSALAAQTETRWKLVVLDNASRIEERPRREDLPANAHFIQSEDNLGFAAGNNRAAQGVDTPYLVLLNPDAFPEPAWLSELLALAERYPGAAAIGSTQIRADVGGVFDGTGDVLHASGLCYRSNFGQPRHAPPPLGESFAACGAAMLIRREAFEAIGGFDERYFCFFEDVDLCFRLRLQGHIVLQSPGAVVHHVGGGSAGVRSAFARFLGARNRLWTFVKCMPPLLFWLLLPTHLALSSAACTMAAFTGGGLAAWRGFFASITGVGPIWTSRQELRRTRKVRAGAIARRLAWSPLVFIGRKPVIFRIDAKQVKAPR